MNIFGIKLTDTSNRLFTGYIEDAIKSDKKIKVSKINTEFLQRAIKDKNFTKVLNDSDLNIVDGRGVLWAARYLTLPISDSKLIRPLQAVWQMIYSGVATVLKPSFIKYPISEAIPGVDALNLVMETAVKNKVGVFIFGSSEDTLTRAVKNIKRRLPDLILSGFMNGYDFQKENKIDPVVEINKTDARILIVALGSPKQELWINNNISKLNHINVAIGEGGTLDRVANPSQKAPKFINRVGLEWLWRTMFNKSKTETRNRFQKLWNAVPLFIYRIIKWKVKNGQTKI